MKQTHSKTDQERVYKRYLKKKKKTVIIDLAEFVFKHKILWITLANPNENLNELFPRKMICQDELRRNGKPE